MVTELEVVAREAARRINEEIYIGWDSRDAPEPAYVTGAKSPGRKHASSKTARW